jgi:hypothetical protein
VKTQKEQINRLRARSLKWKRRFFRLDIQASIAAQNAAMRDGAREQAEREIAMCKVIAQCPAQSTLSESINDLMHQLEEITQERNELFQQLHPVT